MELSKTELLNDITKKYEKILVEKFGAKGRGVYEKVVSVESQLPKDLAEKVKKIGSIRNRALHHKKLTDAEFISVKKQAIPLLNELKALPGKARPKREVVHQTGVIARYSPDQKYGFIAGDDGQDYFVHYSELLQIISDDDLEGKLVSFEAVLGKKGYKARNCQVHGEEASRAYTLPDRFLFAKRAQVQGWPPIESCDWEVVGTSHDSPDQAKANLKERAQSIGGNAIVNLEYFKTTGQSGNYKFTIHNFRGQPAFIGRQSFKGTYEHTPLHSLNDQAALKFKNMDRQRREKSRKKTLMLSLGLLWGFLCFLSPFFLVLAIPCLLYGLFSARGEVVWLKQINGGPLDTVAQTSSLAQQRSILSNEM